MIGVMSHNPKYIQSRHLHFFKPQKTKNIIERDMSHSPLPRNVKKKSRNGSNIFIFY